MLLGKDFVMQGGVRNYLGKTKEVTAPRYWKSSKYSPSTELAYITEAEKGLLLDANLHGSLKNRQPNIGASGLLSYDGWGDASDGFGGGGGSSSGGGGNSGGGNGGGGGRDYSPPSKPSTPTTPSTPSGGGDARESYGAGGQYQQTITPSAPPGGGGRDYSPPTIVVPIVSTPPVAPVTENIMSGYDDFVSKTYGNMPYQSTADIVTYRLPDGTIQQGSSTTMSRINEYLESIGQPPAIDVNSSPPLMQKPVAPPTVKLVEENLIGSMPVAPPSILNPPTTISPPSGGDNIIDPGFVRALDEKARFETSLADPDPYVDVPIEERDTITSFLDNYAANVRANPFELGLIGALKTAYQTGQARDMMRGLPGYSFLGSGLRDDTTSPERGGDTITTTTQPTTTAPVASLPLSMVNQYFANMGNMGQSLSSSLQTSYNNAKNSINNILGITPPSQQFGYSADPYGGLMASNLTTNPYNIDYLRRLGLI